MPIQKPQQRDERGRFISDKDAEARRIAEEKRDKATTKAAETLHQDFQNLAKSITKDVGAADLGPRATNLADVNKKIIKDNSKFFTAKAEQFMGQSTELEATVELGDLSDMLKTQVSKMVDISSEAATADFATLKKLKNDSLASLKSLELIAQTDDSDQLAELIDQSKKQLNMLSQETSLLSSMGEGITSIAKTGLGALAGVVTGNPILAMGVQAIQSGFEKRGEKQRKVVEAQLETAKGIKQQLFDDANEAKESVENLDEEIGAEFAASLDNMLAELVPEGASEEEANELLADVSAKLEDLVDATDEEKNMFSTFLNGSEEERREALDMDRDKLEVFNRMADALESLNKDKKEEDELGIVDVAVGNLAANFIGKLLKNLKFAVLAMFTGMFKFIAAAPKMIGKFIAKGLPKLISRFFAPALILGALFSGISDAIDEYAKSGSIFEAVIAGLAGILDFITFGLVNEEMGKKIFHAITDTFLNIKDALMEQFSGFGDGFINIVKGAFAKVIQGAINMWDDFMADFSNISSFLTDQEWFQNFMDIVGPGFDAVIAMGTTLVSLVTGIWTVAQEKWQAVKNGVVSIFDWFADIFSVDTFKKMIPDTLANLIFDDEDLPINKQSGIDRAKDSEAIVARTLNPFKDSEIVDVAALNNFTALQLRDLIDMDDWSKEDESTLRKLFDKKLREETSTTPDNVIDLDSRRPEIVQQPKVEVIQAAADEPKANEIVKGESQADKVVNSVLSFEKAKKDREERQQVEQRKIAEDTTKTAVLVNNNTKNNTTNISAERTFDVDPSLTLSENRNQVG